jgi:hypothetical protein
MERERQLNRRKTVEFGLIFTIPSTFSKISTEQCKVSKAIKHIKEDRRPGSSAAWIIHLWINWNLICLIIFVIVRLRILYIE